jgi:hypothetical protein
MLLFSVCFLAQIVPASPQDHWEFGFHYGRWNINILRSLIEEGISNAMETELRDQILKDIQNEYPYMVETSYSQNISFDSSGDNFGFEVRWCPGGERGSFSLGLSIEKTTMKVGLPDVSSSLSLRDEITGNSAAFGGRVNGEFLIKPLSYHLSFRWDLFPSSVVHPYISLGFGAATGTALEEAVISYSYSGNLVIPGESPDPFNKDVSKSIRQLKEELESEGEDFFLPGFLPFFQLNLGLKAVVARNVHFLIDAGIWNGFLIRGGVALRL